MTTLAAKRTELLAIAGEEARLRVLHRWLTVGGSSWIVGGGAVFLPYGLIFSLMKVAAIVFAPYMLWRLYQVGRNGWITGFAVTVGLPAVAVTAVSPSGIGGFLLSILPLFMFYAYTWTLRHSVGEWLEELRWKRENLRDRHQFT